MGLKELFWDMFPDSNIAKKFTLSKSKCAYVLNFGIAKDGLREKICASPYFSISFDESLNTLLQQQQMDVQIRFWCVALNKAITRYWNSQFQHRGDAVTLADKLVKSTENLPIERYHQLAMDGPNTNWKILSILQQMQEKEEYPPLGAFLSCGHFATILD